MIFHNKGAKRECYAQLGVLKRNVLYDRIDLNKIDGVLKKDIL